MSNLVPVRYIPDNLTNIDKKKQSNEIKKTKKLYKKNIYYTRKKIKSFKQKPSKHILNAQKLYNIENIKINKELSYKTKCRLIGLKQIFKKGQGAYYSSGSRPNQTPHSWGYARVASAITGGKSSAVDMHILEKYCDKNSKALNLAKKNYNKYKKGTRKVKKTSIKMWSDKYKKTINCKNPKGFSQKQYCKYKH
tara:strand:- start:5245 stop:5826 length:582 start_codon:yes stop_codon:yes gene_type:complete